MNSQDLRIALRRFLAGTLHRIDYLAAYACTVVSQDSSTLAVDLQPDSDRLADMQAVPVAFGPGMRFRVSKGARCLVSFRDGDPRRPYAHGFDPSGFDELAIGGGTQPVARVGDAVSLSIPPGTPLLGMLNGQPWSGSFTMPVLLTGTIVSGAAKVKA